MAGPLKIDEQPRGVRYGDVRGPTELLLEQMRKHSRVVSEILARVAYGHFELEHVMKEVGAQVDDSTAREWEAVSIIIDQLGDMLSEHGVTTEDPIGRAWVDSMRADYDLLGFEKCDDVETPLVGHVNKPLVRRHGRLISKGEVTVKAPHARAGGSGKISANDQEGA